MSNPIKIIIKKIIPQSILDARNHYKTLKLLERNRMLTNSQIENLIGKEYLEQFGRELHWDQPAAYTEKINVSKVYNRDKQKTLLTDKLLVREWVKKIIGEQYLIPLFGVYDSFEKIDFAALPNEFVIKCNHDSGSVFLCKQKNKLDTKNLSRVYDKYFLKRNYAYLWFEMHYRDIKPKILIEKYMGDAILDYKFLCFSGKPYYCWVDTDRFSNHKRIVYDMNWQPQVFNQYTNGIGIERRRIPKPKTFEEMKELASALSKGFDHVRVDLYEIDEKIYFGEMTFTNGNGFERIVPDQYDYELGKLWDFESKRAYFQEHNIHVV